MQNIQLNQLNQFRFEDKLWQVDNACQINRGSIRFPDGRIFVVGVWTRMNTPENLQEVAIPPIGGFIYDAVEVTVPSKVSVQHRWVIVVSLRSRSAEAEKQRIVKYMEGRPYFESGQRCGDTFYVILRDGRNVRRSINWLKRQQGVIDAAELSSSEPAFGR